MQIHELTQRQLDEGLLDLAKGAAAGIAKVGGVAGNFASAVAQPFKDIKGAYKDVKQDAKITAAADKAFNVWTKYADQVAKTYTDPVKKQAYLNRQDGRYEKDLLSFVQQNLLKGLSFSTLNNRDDIMGLIKAITKATVSTATPPAKNSYNNQLAGGQATTTAQGQPVPAGTVPSTATPQAQAQAAAKKPAAPATTTPATPGQTAGAVPSTATPQAQAQAAAKKPAAPATTTPATPGQTAGAVPSTATPQAQAQAAAKKPGTPPATPVKEAADPTQIKQLFLQLVQQTALAQQSVYTGAQQQPTGQPSGQPSGAADPKQMAANLAKLLAAVGVAPNSLATVGQAIMTASGGNPNVRSTGNPVVDMLLKQMGFST
jgi:hypothetical protein